MAPAHFGKLPYRGDFLRSGMADELATFFDAWLAQGVDDCRSRGNGWEDAYLESPVWRFVLQSKDVGAGRNIGLVLPSADRVGRLFPFVLSWPVHEPDPPLALAMAVDPFLAQIEQALLRVLLETEAGFDDFLSAIDSDPDRSSQRSPERASASHLSDLCRDPTVLASSTFEADLWWTSGSDRSPPRVLVGPLESAGILFDAPSSRAREESAPDTQLERSRGHRFEAVAFTVTGRRRENEDAVLVDSEGECWVVVDGMGGHADGRFAATTIVEEIRATPLPNTAGARWRVLEESIERAHQRLRRHGEAIGDSCGAAVVACIADAEQLCVLWCGDARAYIAGEVWRPLTLDHADPQDGRLVRAVGYGESTRIDRRTVDICPGMRVLLASDGVYRALETEVLQGEADMCRAAVELAGSADDNASAVLVKLHSEGDA